MYLFGDLAIYSVAIPNSLAVTTGNVTVLGVSASETAVYYVFLALFGVFCIVVSAFNFQKTKYLQLLTMVLRNVAIWGYSSLIYLY